MSQIATGSKDSMLQAIFGAFIRPQTYINMFYLVLAFPLGTAYFVFLVTGLSLGAGLLVLALVGIPILLIVLAGSWAIASFERQMAIRLLKVDIPPMARRNRSGEKAWDRLKAHLRNPVTWTGMLYLFVKFPLGIASFILTVVLVWVTLSFITAPITYRYTLIAIGSWEIETLGSAFILLPIGLAVGLLAPHVLNYSASLSGRLARVMLGRQ